MKLYITKLVPKEVPIIWQARIRTDLKSSSRKTPKWRTEIKERRREWQELIENDPMIRQLHRWMIEDLKRAEEIPKGETVKFTRFVPLPPIATEQIKINEND